MKAIRTISISSKEYFTELEQSLLKMANVGRTVDKITIDELIQGKTIIRNPRNIYKKDRFTMDEYIPYSNIKGHISSVIEDISFEYKIESTKKGCTITYTSNVIKKLEKQKSKVGQMWMEALSLSRMVNEIIEIEKKVNKRKSEGKK